VPVAAAVPPRGRRLDISMFRRRTCRGGGDSDDRRFDTQKRPKRPPLAIVAIRRLWPYIPRMLRLLAMTRAANADPEFERRLRLPSLGS
jgi:hypothetical protein